MKNKKVLKDVLLKLEKIQSETSMSMSEIQEQYSDQEERMNEGDAVDQSSVISEMSRLKSLQKQMEVKVTQINSAKKRIDAGTFGVCCDCEDDIPSNRLLANPFSIRCLSCQEDLEQDQKEAKMRGQSKMSLYEPTEESKED